MPNQVRVAKVLAALLASMTTGAIVLMALGHNPPSAGPFSLWTYQRLDPVQDALSLDVLPSLGRWNSIEIHYSGTRAGSIEQSVSPKGLVGPKEFNCHFLLCNGLGGDEGEIQPTQKWKQQLSAGQGRTWERIIRICLVADGSATRPTDCQIKRLQVLVETLRERFDIAPDAIDYPSNWR